VPSGAAAGRRVKMKKGRSVLLCSLIRPSGGVPHGPPAAAAGPTG